MVRSKAKSWIPIEVMQQKTSYHVVTGRVVNISETTTAMPNAYWGCQIYHKIPSHHFEKAPSPPLPAELCHEIQVGCILETRLTMRYTNWNTWKIQLLNIQCDYAYKSSAISITQLICGLSQGDWKVAWSPILKQQGTMLQQREAPWPHATWNDYFVLQINYTNIIQITHVR